MEREAELNNITCASEFGGKNATEGGVDGLFRLSCRYRKHPNKISFCSNSVKDYVQQQKDQLLKSTSVFKAKYFFFFFLIFEVTLETT